MTVRQYAHVSMDIVDVMEEAEREGFIMSEEDAEALLQDHETAINEAGHYAMIAQIRDVLKLRRERGEG